MIGLGLSDVDLAAAIKLTTSDRQLRISTYLLHHTPLRYADIVPRTILHHVHHFVRLMDYVMRSLGVMRIGRQANRCAHVQVETFIFAEVTGTEAIAKPPGDHQGGIFWGLRQQDNEFIAAVAKSEINQPQLRLDQVSDFGQQLAADEVPVRIIHLLEMVEIDKDD